MYEGRVTASFESPRAADVEAMGLHMTGGEDSPGTVPAADEGTA
jgi:hypothetical protein